MDITQLSGSMEDVIREQKQVCPNLPVLHQYICAFQFGTLEIQRLQTIREQNEAELSRGYFFFVLPSFVIFYIRTNLRLIFIEV
jgi:hypothetical protein